MTVKEINYNINLETKKIDCSISVILDNNLDEEMWFNASTTCLPEDKWNQEKGCKIALLKAKRKAIEKENKFIDSKIDCAKVLMENLKKMMRQDYNKMIKNAKYKNLLNEELNKYIK